MKKSRFIVVILCSILSLCLLAVVEIVWAMNSYNTMRQEYNSQIYRILEEASWQYAPRNEQGPITMGSIDRLSTIVADELRTAGLDTEYTVEVLVTTNDKPITLMMAQSGDIGTERMTTEVKISPIILRLTVKDPHAEILSNMRLTLTLQIISIVVLTIAFVYLCMTLFRAKSVERIRRDLTHNITHELKTPIAAAYAATDVLRSTPDIADDKNLRNNYLDMALTELKRLEEMVEEILRSATEEFEHSALHIEECNIGDMVRSAQESLTLKYRERDIVWHINIEEHITLHADLFHLQAALVSLIDNAIKYSPDNPTVTIEATRDDRHVTIIVRDNGIGIPMGERKHIFEKFYRISHGIRHDTKGYGLGLYYVERVVKRHGGNIKCNSKVGHGSEFRINIPIYGKTHTHSRR